MHAWIELTPAPSGHAPHAYVQVLVSLSPQRLAPALLPHLTGHRAVTGQLTGHVSLFRFHAILSNKFGISESEVLRCLYAVCSPVGLAVQVL